MSCCSQAIGFFLSILAGGDPQIASAGVGPLALVLMLLGGFYVNTETLPIYLTWISKGSYLTFSYQGICINEFRNALLLADGVETYKFIDSKFGNAKKVRCITCTLSILVRAPDLS